MIVAALGAWFGGRWGLIPGAVHEPVAVLIADFQNQTGDPAFDRTLEPVMKLALEGAGFITAFDRSGIARTMGVRPPEILDEKAARRAGGQAGRWRRALGDAHQGRRPLQGRGQGREAVSGNVIADENDTASGKDGVLGVVDEPRRRRARGAWRRCIRHRAALCDGDAVGHLARRGALVCEGMEALSRSQFNEAFQGLLGTAAKDPKFGLAYAGMAIASNNMGRQQDAEKYVKEAHGLVDGMTERERYRTRGMFYFITNDYQPCVKEYGDLIAKYSG